MSEAPAGAVDAARVAEVLDGLAAPLWRALDDRIGPLALFDAHTHIGENDPDGHSQRPGDLLEALGRADARAATFAMHEPGGYGPANDAVLEVAERSGGRLVPFCRVDPNAGAVPEARRCLDAGARGIKLHPRAEGFTLSEPAVEELVRLAGERGVPVLIHAGRGIPALGPDALGLARAHPEARLILAHAAVSDLAWIWRELPDHPNLFADTAWWTPGDMIALFSLVPAGQILFGSDSPYAPPLTSAVQHFAYAIQAGVEPQALRLIAGEQFRRLIEGEEPARAGIPHGEREPLDPLLERLVQHLVSAVARCTGAADPSEPVALARLACAVEEGPHAERCATVLDLLDEAAPHLPPPEGVRWGVGAQILALAIAIARTPNSPLPERPSAPATREHAEHGG